MNVMLNVNNLYETFFLDLWGHVTFLVWGHVTVLDGWPLNEVFPGELTREA